MEDVPTCCLFTLSGWVPVAGPRPAPQALEAITHHGNSQGLESRVGPDLSGEDGWWLKDGRKA